MSILLYVKLNWCSGIPQIYGQLEDGSLVYVHSAICEKYLVQWHSIDLWSIGECTCALGICAFCYMLNLFSVVVFHRTMVNWRGYICPKYICILLYVKLIQCSGIPQNYGQLEEGGLVYVHSAICQTYLVQWYSIDLWSIGGGTSALNICAFCYMLNLFRIVVFYRYMVNWGKGALVCMHSAIC